MQRHRFTLLTTLGAMLLILLNPLGIDLYLPAMPAMAQHFLHDVQLTLSAFVLSIGPGQLLFGPLSDRIGRRPVALAGVLLYGTAAALIPLAANLPVLIGLRLLQGLGASATSVVAFSVIRDVFDGDEAARRYSLLNGALNIVPSAAPLAGAVLVQAAGWQSTFAALAVIAALIGLATLRLMPETRRPRTMADEIPLSFAQVLRDRHFQRYGSCCAAALMIIISYVTLAPEIMIDKAGLSPLAFSSYFAANALLLIAASLVVTRRIQRRGRHRVLTEGLVLMMAGGILMLLVSGFSAPWHYMLPVGVVSLGFALTLGPANGLAMTAFPHGAGRAAAVLGCVQMMSAALFSAMLASLPLAAEWRLGSAIVLLGGLCLWLTRSGFSEPTDG